MFTFIWKYEGRSLIFAEQNSEYSKIMQKKYRKLCTEIENKVGKAIQTPTDFEWLEDKIMAKLKERISASTLMRI